MSLQSAARAERDRAALLASDAPFCCVPADDTILGRRVFCQLFRDHQGPHRWTNHLASRVWPEAFLTNELGRAQLHAEMLASLTPKERADLASRFPEYAPFHEKDPMNTSQSRPVTEAFKGFGDVVVNVADANDGRAPDPVTPPQLPKTPSELEALEARNAAYQARARAATARHRGAVTSPDDDHIEHERTSLVVRRVHYLHHDQPTTEVRFASTEGNLETLRRAMPVIAEQLRVLLPSPEAPRKASREVDLPSPEAPRKASREVDPESRHPLGSSFTMDELKDFLRAVDAGNTRGASPEAIATLRELYSQARRAWAKPTPKPTPKPRKAAPKKAAAKGARR